MLASSEIGFHEGNEVWIVKKPQFVPDRTGDWRGEEPFDVIIDSVHSPEIRVFHRLIRCIEMRDKKFDDEALAVCDRLEFKINLVIRHAVQRRMEEQMLPNLPVILCNFDEGRDLAGLEIVSKTEAGKKQATNYAEALEQIEPIGNDDIV